MKSAKLEYELNRFIDSMTYLKRQENAYERIKRTKMPKAYVFDEDI